MTNILIPYTFVAGTKAKAEEVNANFQTLKTAIEATDSNVTSLSGTLDNKVGALSSLTTAAKTSAVAAINELNEKVFPTFFTMNSGYINSSAKAEILSYSSATLSFKVDDATTYAPLTATTAKGITFTLTSIASVSAANYQDGTYNVFVDSSAATSVLANTISRQASAPSNPSSNDVWLKTLEPLEAYKYSGSAWETFDFVPLGSVTVASGVITGVKTFAYNQNGYNINTKTFPLTMCSESIFSSTTAGATYTLSFLPDDGGVYELFLDAQLQPTGVDCTMKITSNYMGLQAYLIAPTAGRWIGCALTTFTADRKITVSYTDTVISSQLDCYAYRKVG